MFWKSLSCSNFYNFKSLQTLFDFKWFLSSDSNSMSTRSKTEGYYRRLYNKKKRFFESKPLPKDICSTEVFACNELNLDEIKVYGFDYEYALASFKSKLHGLIYDLGREILVKKFNYPKDVMKLEFVPNFVIRGLHYHIERGLLFKMDSCFQVQVDTVCKGLTPVPKQDVIKFFKKTTISEKYLEPHIRTKRTDLKIIQMADLFSVPEMCLLSNVIESFEKHNLSYNPEILFHDVIMSVRAAIPLMHQIVLDNAENFIKPDPKLREYLSLLVEGSKKLFLIANSEFSFLDKGMCIMVGPDWRDFFDVIIVQAKKPSFFQEESRPLRIYDVKSNTQLWGRVTKLEKGKIYYEGTVKQLKELTGWSPESLLYFGDNPYGTSQDSIIQHGWRTGAIVSDLTNEINALNDDSFKKKSLWLQALTDLIEETQDDVDEAAKNILQKWMKERNDLRQQTKMAFNKQFGSCFRTFSNPSFLTKKLFQWNDIYTSHITNMLDHSLHHTFFPKRGVLAHEYMSYIS